MAGRNSFSGWLKPYGVEPPYVTLGGCINDAFQIADSKLSRVGVAMPYPPVAPVARSIPAQAGERKCEVYRVWHYDA